MTWSRWQFSAQRFLILAVLGSFVGGCGESSGPPAETITLTLDPKGPPSAAAADVKTPIIPPEVEPSRVRPTVIDYGPSSAAAADAAQFKPR